MVEILRLGIIVVQDNVFISLISTFLRQLGTSSAIDFLDNDGTGFGVCERNVECDIPVYEFTLSASPLNICWSALSLICMRYMPLVRANCAVPFWSVTVL